MKTVAIIQFLKREFENCSVDLDPESNQIIENISKQISNAIEIEVKV